MGPERDLVQKLTEIVGAENVLTAGSQRACYASDFYPGDWLPPDAVVLPRRTAEISAVVRLAYECGLPLVPRGAGTSVTGGPLPVRGGLVVDLSRLNQLLHVDPDGLYADMEPGVVWADLNRLLAAHQLFTPSTPGSGRVSTVGGNLASGGSGMRSLKYGPVREQVLALTAVLPGGEELNLGHKDGKTACGYDLKDLFIGSEGTLGIITRVTLKVWPKPPASFVAEVEVTDLAAATSMLQALRRDGLTPSAFELVPASTLRLVGRQDFQAQGLLLVEFQGSVPEVAFAGQRLRDLAANLKIRVWVEVEEQAACWRRFSDIYFRLVRLKPSPIAEDIGVGVAEVPRSLRAIEELLHSHDVVAGLMSHAGDGTVHCVLVADASDKEEWLRVQAARAGLYRLILDLGGSITAEHGLGVYRAPFAGWQLGPALALMRRIKRLLDPAGLMNPGKMGLEEG